MQKAPLRFGPDLIHLSILMFITIGVYSLQQQTQEITLAAGEVLELPHGYKLEIVRQDSQYKNKVDSDAFSLSYKLKKDRLLAAEGSSGAILR